MGKGRARRGINRHCRGESEARERHGHRDSETQEKKERRKKREERWVWKKRSESASTGLAQTRRGNAAPSKASECDALGVPPTGFLLAGEGVTLAAETLLAAPFIAVATIPPAAATAAAATPCP